MRKKHLAALLVWIAAVQVALAISERSCAAVSAVYWLIVTMYWTKKE